MQIKLKPQLSDSINLGSLDIDKGNSEGQDIVLFDAITNCVMKDCPIYSDCPCKKDKNKVCTIREKYLNHCLKTLNGVPNKLDDLATMKIGFSLIPMYSQLINFKILAHSLPSVMEGRKIHPVYREIRECIKIILTLLKDLAPDDKEQFEIESSDYYNELFTTNTQDKKAYKRKFLKVSPRNSNVRNFKG